MTESVRTLTEEHLVALQAYLAGAQETTLIRAYELGRRTIESGLGVLDVVGAHQVALSDILGRATGSEDPIGISQTAGDFLAECLAPFEMTHRGFREANARLRELNELLEKQMEELRRAKVHAETTNQELEATNQKLKETQAYLVQSEKMASLGQLVAGIAHEINNPLAFVLNNIFTIANSLKQIAREVTPQLTGASLKKLEKAQVRLGEMKEGLERVKELVLKLRTFSRLDEGTFKRVDLHEGLEAVLLFLRHRFQGRIEVERDYCADGTLSCYAGQLNQVFMNVIANAVEAIEGQGKITITTCRDSESFDISVRDTGRGIPEAIRHRVFEPFFTTKPVGQGTGLGLAISYSIVQKHQGTIEVFSREEQGTEFLVKIPLGLKEETRS